MNKYIIMEDKMKIKHLFVIISIMLLTSLNAQESENPVKVHGFMGQSFIFSQENDFLVANSEKGSHELNEVGLTITSQISPKFRVGFQLLSRDFGDLDNNKTQLDWAFADYRYKDYLGVRFGRVKLPYGLYNEGRDTDILRPMVFLPQSVYDENYRPYLLAYQGTGIYGNYSHDKIGSFDYNFYSGGMNLNKDEMVMRVTNDIASSVVYAGVQKAFYQTVMNAFLGQGLSAADAQTQTGLVMGATTFDFAYEYTEARCTQLFGGTLFWNTPVNGLRTGFSFTRVDLDFYSPKTIATIDAPAPFGTNTLNFTKKRDGGIPARWAVSGEWQYNTFTFASEFNKTTLRQNFYDETTLAKTAKLERDEISYYGMLSWMMNDQITFSLLYDFVKIDRQEAITPAGTTDLLAGTDDWRNQRSDIAFGGRYDFNSNITFKAEYHLMNGYAKVYSEYLDPIDNSAAGAEENWSYAIFKASYNF